MGPGILTISFYWILPESIPWLAVNDRLDEAEQIIKGAAKFNGVTLPDTILLSEEEKAKLAEKPKEANKSMSNKIKETFAKKGKAEEKSEEAGDDAKYTMLDVIRNPTLRKYAIIMCLLWLVNSMVYYGLSLSTEALAGDFYMNFFLSGVA